MKTVAIVSQKGGSGKTTIAVHLAVCAILRKKLVAMIDIDPQAALSRQRSQLGHGRHLFVEHRLPGASDADTT